jgi:hypothetical protein
VMKKTKRYLITFDERQEDRLVWIMHADYTVRLTTLHPVDISDSDIPTLDLTDYGATGPRIKES